MGAARPRIAVRYRTTGFVRSAADSVCHESETMPDPRLILLIEDDREIATTLRTVLENAEYKVAHAPNGKEGKRLISELHPDLVITDMMMPQLGGFPVLEFLQTVPEAERPKVIMITANEGGRHKAYAEMLGVETYLRKPFAMDLMLDAVEKALSKPEEPVDAPKRAVRKKTADE